MSQSYPIWNKITACIYKSNNSHHFLNHRTTHKVLENGDREYRFYVDDVLIKRALLMKGSGNIKSLGVKI